MTLSGERVMIPLGQILPKGESDEYRTKGFPGKGTVGKRFRLPSEIWHGADVSDAAFDGTKCHGVVYIA